MSDVAHRAPASGWASTTTVVPTRAALTFRFAIISVAFALAAGGCAPKRLALPQGTGTPLADATPVFAEAVGHCAALRTLTAEVGLSGRAGGQRLRVRLIAGLAAPDGIRLEAMAPMGPPVFILASAADRTVLLLPRDERVLTGPTPAAILEALAGISVTPDTLRRLLAGCPPADLKGGSARMIGSDWVSAATVDGDTAYLRRIQGRWHLVATRGPALDAELGEGTGVHPGRVRLSSPETASRTAFDLTLRLSQVEVNVDVPAEAFTVRVPAGATPITLDELRQSGPLRDRSSS